jgi:hypothetical protein
MNTKNYLLIILLALAAASCTSPLDVDTPRDKDLDSLATPTTVRATSMTLTFNTVNTVGQYQFNASGTAVIDTGKADPVLWVTITGTAPAGTLATMPMRAFTLHLDSVKASATLPVIGTPADPIGAEMTMQSPGTVPQSSSPDGTIRTLDLHFAFDRTARTLTADIDADAFPNGRSLPMTGKLTIGY